MIHQNKTKNNTYSKRQNITGYPSRLPVKNEKYK